MFEIPIVPIFILLFIFGSIVGSFVNVVALRHGTKLSSAKGRSMCFNCGKELRWMELVPIVSFFFLRGKCRSCKTKISWQYPLVEILTGLLFVGTALRQWYLWPLYSSFKYGLLYSVMFFVYYAFVFGLLMVITIYDVRHKIIPDKFVYLFILLSILKLGIFFVCKGFVFSVTDYLDLLAPFILFSPFALLWLISSGRWIGFGDAKLAFGVGALIGFVSGLSAIILAFWIGAVFSLILLTWSKVSSRSKRRLNMKSEVPFAPFIILASVIIFFSRVDLLGIGKLLNIF